MDARPIPSRARFRIAAAALVAVVVVGGAVVGILGTLAVRHWFAVRGLGFAIGEGGAITHARISREIAGP